MLKTRNKILIPIQPEVTKDNRSVHEKKSFFKFNLQK